MTGFEIVDFSAGTRNGKYPKKCGHFQDCACEKYREPGDAIQPVGEEPARKAEGLHRPHQPLGEAGVGGEGQGRGLDRPEMGIRPGDRVIAYDGLGRAFPGTAIGQVTKDPEGYWAVHLDRQDPEDRIACRLQDMTRVYEL